MPTGVHFPFLSFTTVMHTGRKMYAIMCLFVKHESAHVIWCPCNFLPVIAGDVVNRPCKQTCTWTARNMYTHVDYHLSLSHSLYEKACPADKDIVPALPKPGRLPPLTQSLSLDHSL